MSDTETAQPKRFRFQLLSRIEVLRRLAWALIRGGDRDAETRVEEALQTAEGGQAMDVVQKDMILNAARFEKLKVEDVMTPRADIVALDADTPLGEAARMFAESQHSRLPIYRDTLDDPLGLVHVKDLLVLMAPDENGATKGQLSDRVLSKLKREILFVPASMALSTLLLKMQSRRIHLALVVDEYGGTDGIISIEDIVEQIVGDIEDEHDEDSLLVQARPAGAFEADGRASIEELEKALGASLALPDDEEGEVDTVGGLAVVLAGRLPQRGEVLHHPAGFDVEVMDSDPRRVKRVRIRPVPRVVPEGNAA